MPQQGIFLSVTDNAVAFNHGVEGSGPSALTKQIKD